LNGICDLTGAVATLVRAGFGIIRTGDLLSLRREFGILRENRAGENEKKNYRPTNPRAVHLGTSNRYRVGDDTPVEADF